MRKSREVKLTLSALTTKAHESQRFATTQIVEGWRPTTQAVLSPIRSARKRSGPR
jgi:hypothetical protein